MRRLNLAAAIAFAALAAGCAPRMTSYAYPKYGFSVDFPASTTVSAVTDPQTGAHVTVFDAKSLGRDFAVSVSDVDPARDIDALVEDASQAMAKATGGEVTYRSYASTAEGVLGRQLVFARNGDRLVRASYYSSGGRFYILTARSSMGLNPGADTNPTDPSTQSDQDNDGAVNTFLSSFHVTGAAKRP